MANGLLRGPEDQVGLALSGTGCAEFSHGTA